MNTTPLCRWSNVKRESVSVGQYIVGSLGDYGDDFDVDAIEGEFRAAIDAGLPDTVSLVGEEFVIDWDARFDVGIDDLREIIDDIDLWAIVERHTLTDAEARRADKGN